MSPRIFVTVGNSLEPFDRLAEAICMAIEHSSIEPSGVFQRGSCTKEIPGLKSINFLSRTDFQQQMKEADMVICHGGVGTLHAAMHAGLRPLVMPRLLRYQEIVNDHQEEIVTELLKRDLVTPFETAEQLAEAFAQQRYKLSSPLHPNSSKLEMSFSDTFSTPTQQSWSWLTRMLLLVLSLGKPTPPLLDGETENCT